MFNRLIFGVVVILAARVSFGDDEVVEVCLSEPWSFAYTAQMSGVLPGDECYQVSMPVPGCWDDTVHEEQAKGYWADATINPGYRPIEFPFENERSPDGSLPFLYGVGWYRRTVEVPAEWRGRQVVLNVGYVVAQATVYINGKQVHHHFGHSTNWQVNVSDGLDYGRSNEIVIAVQNSDYSRGGCRIRGWKGRSGGIYDRVYLKVSGAARVADVYVYPEDDRLCWQVELEGELKSDAVVQWRVVEPETKAVIGSGSQQASGSQVMWKTGLLGMKAWSDREPCLYELEVELVQGGQGVDVQRQPFGMRRLTVNGLGLRLNGEPVYLRGVCEHAYFAETCTPSTDAAWYREYLGRLKAIGFNWLRFHTWVPSEPYMQAADELGVMIQVEGPSGFAMEEWRDILWACRKHPSVVIYCGGNEQLLDEEKIAFLRECAMLQKELVPDGLFNPMEGDRGVTREGGKDDPYNGFGVERIEEPIPHNPVRMAKLREFCDVFSPYAWGDLSYSTVRGESRWIDYRTLLYGRPVLSHELGIIGSYLNFDLESRYEGTRIGTRLYKAAREYLEREGMFGRAGIYYRNAVKLQQILRKDVLEMTRKCYTLCGYDLLAASDCHWHRTGYTCGILNEFCELKLDETAGNVLEHNGESILMISEQRDRNVRADDPFTRTILTSWYSPEALEDGVLEWRLRDGQGTIYKQGRSKAPIVLPGHIAELGDIGFILPDLPEATKVTLEVKLSTPVRVLKNRWEFWIYPYSLEIQAKDVIVTEKIDGEIFDKLVSGSRVVLLGGGPFPTRELRFQEGVAGRPGRNFGTVIEKHPLMDRFPHDGFCSWQFYPMMKRRVGSAAVRFNELNVPFDPIIEMVSSYKDVQRQAVLFEVQVGEGKLLVCTLKLGLDDYGADYLRKIIVNYAASDAFAPRTVMSADVLKGLVFGTDVNEEEVQKTDEGLDPRVQSLLKEKGRK